MAQQQNAENVEKSVLIPVSVDSETSETDLENEVIEAKVPKQGTEVSKMAQKWFQSVFIKVLSRFFTVKVSLYFSFPRSTF